MGTEPRSSVLRGVAEYPTGESDRNARRWVYGAVLTLCFLIWQTLWAVLTPSFRGPDEVQHFDAVLRVAATGEWPMPGNAIVDTEVINATHEAGFMAGDDDFFALANKTPLRGGQAEFAGYAPPYAYAEILPAAQRSVINYGTGGDPEHINQMTQHPPLYYEILGGALNIVGGLNWTWDSQLLFLRFLSILMVLPVIPSILYASRRIGFGLLGSTTAAVSLFAIPQFVFATSVITNDALAIGAGALTIAACSEGMFGRASWRTVIAAGLALGLGLWSKGTFLPMGLLVGLSFVVNGSGGAIRERWLKGVSAGLIGVLVGGFWWVRNVLEYGSLQPAGAERLSIGAGTAISRYLHQSFRLFVDSSWGQLGWLEWFLPAPMITLMAGGTAVCLVVTLTRGPQRAKKLVLISFYLATGAVLLVQAWTAYQESGYVSGIQGRYLFPGIVGLIVVATSAWIPFYEKYSLRRRWLPLIPSGFVTALALGALYLWMRACYLSTTGRVAIDWSRWSLATGFSTGSLQIWTCLGVAGLVVAAFIPVLISMRRSGVRDDGV